MLFSTGDRGARGWVPFNAVVLWIWILKWSVVPDSVLLKHKSSALNRCYIDKINGNHNQ